VARVISRFGGDVEALYLAGGEIGSFLDRLLKSEQVAARRIDVAGQTRIGFVVCEQVTGLEYRFVSEGPIVSADDLQTCCDIVSSGSWDYVILSGSLPRGVPDNAYARMATCAASRGARVILDTSGIALSAALEKSSVFLVKPSRGELEKLVGRELDEEGVKEAASNIVSRGAAELVAVSLGADGALLASSSGILREPAIPVNVRSSVGAGDSFVGAMTWALSEGKSHSEAFRTGLAAGAASIVSPGTRLCQPSDVFDLLNRSWAAQPPPHKA
jgi:6-phosphofructokinase 2